MAEIFAKSSSRVVASAAAGMSSQCPVQTPASSSQDAEMVKISGFIAPQSITPLHKENFPIFGRGRSSVDLGSVLPFRKGVEAPPLVVVSVGVRKHERKTVYEPAFEWVV